MPTSDSTFVRLVILVTVLTSTVCLILFGITTLHWPLVNDASLMHYVAFMVDNGFAPYRDLKDMQFPGGFLLDWAVMHSLGQGALAWRLYDFTLLGLAAIAMLRICWPNRWTGFLAAALFALFHGRDGVGQSGQRDLAIAVLILWSYAFASIPERRGMAAICAMASGVALGAATTIKPTALIFLFLVAWMVLHPPGSSSGLNLSSNLSLNLSRLVAFSAGFTLPILAVMLFLIYKHALTAFWNVSAMLLPYHASLARQSFGQLLHEAFFGSLLWIALVTAALLIIRRRWQSRQSMALLIAVICGYCSYHLQGKGYLYQRYPMIAFLLILATLEFTGALYYGRIVRIASLVAILYVGAVLPPLYLLRASKDRWREDTLVNSLSTDLLKLKGVDLNHNVQCIDSVSGCLNTLYRLKIVQATGYLYDEFLLGPHLTPTLIAEREKFWTEFQSRPPQVVVVTGSLFPLGPQNYEKLDRWPVFRDYLRSHYHLISERQFEPGMTGPLSYRVYQRR